MKNLKNKKYKILFSCFLVIPLLLLMCGRSEKKQGGKFEKYYKFVDRLNEENIVRSPLKDIVKKFRFIKKDISQDWEYIRELSDNNAATWAFSTSHPVLGKDDKIPAEEIKLLQNGKKVKYLAGKLENGESWRWVKTSEDIDLSDRDLFAYNRQQKGIVIDAKHPFKFEKLLPAGEAALFLSIDTINMNKRYRKELLPMLIVSIGDKYEKHFRISPQKKKLKMVKKVAAGLYNIEVKIKNKNPTGDKPAQEAVVLKKIRLSSNSDILLYTKKPGGKKEPPEGEFQLQYYSGDSLTDGENQSLLPVIQYLYQLKDKSPVEDPGIGTNPFSIKKKITWGEYSLNSLTAPPGSEYAFQVKIPQDCRLEFGYGFLNEAENPAAADKIVKFKVAVKSPAGKKYLLDENINLRTHQEFIFKEIDLASYENKEVELSFITELIKPGHKTDFENFPVWLNPLLYTPSGKNDINIVLISLDTVRPDYLGCYGCRENTSPAIDKFTADAVLFLNAFSSTAWTLPAHVSLMTSLDCLNHQVYYPYEKMSPDNITLAAVLRKHNFFTGAVTGGGFLSSTYGFAKGFDFYQELKTRENEAIHADEAEYLAAQSLNFITKNKDKQFFLFLHTYQPHDPYSNPSTLGKQFLGDNPKWQQVSLVDLFKKTGRFNYPFSGQEKKNIAALYKGEIKYTDQAFFAPIIDRLRELKIYDKTMIILLSDHGEEFYDHEAWLHDHSLYEEAIRIPLIIKLPLSVNKGKRIKNITRITDVCPTILDMVNIKTGSYEFDGESLLPLIAGKETEQRTLLTDLAIRGNRDVKIIAKKRGDLKFILNEKVVSPHVKKTALEFAGFFIELYDLKKDPGETLNLAAQPRYKKICIDLLKEIRSIYKNARRRSAGRGQVTMDKNLLEKLKALGYIK